MMTEQEHWKEYHQLKKDYPDIVRFIPIVDEDNWYLNYSDETVKGEVILGISFEYVYEEKPSKPKYLITISFWGNQCDDDIFMMKKWYYNDDLNKVVEVYKEYIDYLNKVPENINLKEYLEKDDFILM